VVTYVHGGSAYKLEALEVSSVGLTPITSINIKKILNIIQKLKKNIFTNKNVDFSRNKYKILSKTQKKN